MIYQLASNVTQFQNELVDGCLVAKVIFYRLKHNVYPDASGYQLLKLNHRLAVLESRSFLNEEVIGCLKMTVLFHPSGMTFTNDKTMKQESLRYFQTIQPEQVYRFSNQTGDENSIHLTETPIVQGLFLLQLIDEEYNHPNEIDMKFLAPIYAGHPIYIEEQKSNVCGYSQNRLCFQAIIN